MEKIQIKYFDKDIDKIEKISQGDLIDLRAAETVHMKAGEYKRILREALSICPHRFILVSTILSR